MLLPLSSAPCALLVPNEKDSSESLWQCDTKWTLMGFNVGSLFECSTNFVLECSNNFECSTCCVWDTSYFLVKSKVEKDCWTFKSIERSSTKKKIDWSCQGTECWTFESGWRPKSWMLSNKLNIHAKTQHVEHSILFEHSKKQNLWNIQWRSQHWTPSTSILWCLPKWFRGIFLIWKLSRAHGALDKGSNIENFYSAKKQGECLNK